MIVLKKYLQWHRKTIKRELIILFLIFLLNLFLVLFYLTPSFLEINPEDGAKYVESGRKLLIWGLRDISWGPLVAFIYAPIHILVGNSPNWFMLEAWIGNIVLYTLMWFSFILLARQLNNSVYIYVLVGLLFTWVGYHRIQFNQSDALFLPLSVLALTNILQFRRYKSIKNVWFASLFVGLGILSRAETLVLAFPLLAFSIWFNKKRYKLHHVILACLGPMIGILFAYILLSMITLGRTNLGMMGKGYFSYTHPLVQNFLPGSKNLQAYSRGEPIFGTFEENQGSLIRTILINPSVLFERIAANILSIPNWIADYFGLFNRWILIFFGSLGFYRLIKSKEYEVLFLLIIWPLHAMVALIFETLHFIPQTSYLFLIFPSIGLTYFLSDQAGIKAKIAVIIISFILVVGSLVSQSYSWLAAAFLILIAALINFLVKDPVAQNLPVRVLPAVILLTGMLFFQDGFIFPALKIGQSEDEIAVHALQKMFPLQTKILAMQPKPIVAAKMEHARYPEEINKVDELNYFFIENQVEGIYFDDKLHFPSDLMGLLLIEYPEAYILVHQSESRNIRIFRFIGRGFDENSKSDLRFDD